MSVNEYHEKCRTRWVDAIEKVVGSSPEPTTCWTGVSEIVEALTPFIGTDSHLHFPTGGGHDIQSVSEGRDDGTIELHVSDGYAYLVRPDQMKLEYVEADPAQSFIAIDLKSLEPSGVYDDEYYEGLRDEEYVELSDGQLKERAVLDRGYIGHDVDGNEIPLPDSARLLHRLFSGRLLLVAKGTIWNGSPRTYTGIHDRLTNQEIREGIERVVAKSNNET